MPLILVTGAPTASGHEYDDVVAEQYEFPTRRYQSLVLPGTPFIYYRGRRASSLGLTGLVYFGTGLIGQVNAANGGRSTAKVLDYKEFTAPVPFKTVDGAPLEPGAVGNGAYYFSGVRTVDDATFANILELARHEPGDMPQTPVPASGARYARDPEVARLVNEYAIAVAKATLAQRHGQAAVTVMPHNNPGYDINVVRPGATDLHVEVKGTRLGKWAVFLSEGERLHSLSYPTALIVVYGIDLQAKTHEMFEHTGPIEASRFEMSVRQWSVSLPDTSPGPI